MKLKNILIAAMMMLVLPFQSCTLEEDTQGLSTPDDFFRKYSECQSVVNSCYIPIKSIYTFTMMIATECVSDVLSISSGTLDARLDISPAIPRHGATVWQNGYLGVQRCNFAIAGIERAYKQEILSIEEYNQLICEAKTLRGFYYWLLTSFFGDVPFYFDDVTDNAVLNRIAMLPRMDACATRTTVIEDMLPAAAAATQTRTSENPGQRVGAALAYHLIAKMAMWNASYDKAQKPEYWWGVAKDALHKVEDIYGDLAQYDFTENALWRNHNTLESIMEVQHIYVLGGLSYTSNVSCICMPHPRTTGTYIFDGVEIPEIGDQPTVWTAMRPNVFFSQGLQGRKAKDIRRNVNMAWDYTGADGVTREFKSINSKPWPGPKFWCPNQQGSSDGNNYKIFRYSDAVLMLAECYCETGDYETAVKYLDKTRVRAGLQPYTFRTVPRLQEEIRNERARELFGDMQRKFDLVRWGIWYEATTSYSDYKYLQLGNNDSMIKPCHRFYPIPDIQVTYSKGNLDNKEYNAYGL